MLFFPNAKINIGLNVISKRPDGYHNIETVFCPIGLADALEFVPSPGLPPGEIELSVSGIPLDGRPDSNLCIKAYRLLHKDFTLPAVEVYLHKNIPAGAGLGGGSSDAAFMLKNLNDHFELKLNEDDLCNYASQLGSDCAFFIRNKPVFGYERGNLFREIPQLPDQLEIALVNPGIHISTAEAYAGVYPRQPAGSLETLIGLPPWEWKENIINDFETGILAKHPVIGEIKLQLYRLGAVYASMSGSGSSIYGLFNKKIPELKDHFPGLFCWSGNIIQTQP